MATETDTGGERMIGAPLKSGPAVPWTQACWARLTSLPALAFAFLVTIVLAAGPLQHVDQELDHHWLLYKAPALLPFVQSVLDRIAGQAVCLPVLALVAIVLAWRRRSWRPILLGVSAELAFLIGVGGLKVLLARPSSSMDNPGFFDGGILDLGGQGISFPSGHAAEAVLMYGVAVHLINRYSSATARTVTLLHWVVALIALNSVVASFLLGWHWLTDLIGGVAAGAFFLRLLIGLDDHWRRPPGPQPSSSTDETPRPRPVR